VTWTFAALFLDVPADDADPGGASDSSVTAGAI
jgi:hypothetical protein